LPPRGAGRLGASDGRSRRVLDFPGWEQHKFRAWQEHLQRTSARVAYEAYTSNDEQVVARVLDTGAATGG
jgi:hypothetical protein